MLPFFGNDPREITDEGRVKVATITIEENWDATVDVTGCTSREALKIQQVFARALEGSSVRPEVEICAKTVLDPCGS